MVLEILTMRRSMSFAVCVGLAMLFTLGCSSESAQTTNTEPSQQSPDSKYRLSAEPAGAEAVKAARSAAKDGDEIVVVGRVGGDANPWVEGQAAFLIVDTSLKPCGADEGCPTPWDYCCDLNLLAESKAMIKVVDDQGQLERTDARKLFGIKELQTVVVKGQAKRDEAGNLTVLANGIFVRP
jgi:hypothetical protein